MALHYVLDGYNIIKQSARFCAGTLEDNRRALLNYLVQGKPQGSSRNAVTVVFDGQGGWGSWLDSAGVSGIRVIFSVGENADERIKTIVDKDAHPRSMVVVTDDREIRYYVRSLGARILGVKEFLAQSRSVRREKSRPEKVQTDVEPKEISASIESDITSEMSRLWLRRGNGRK